MTSDKTRQKQHDACTANTLLMGSFNVVDVMSAAQEESEIARLFFKRVDSYFVCVVCVCLKFEQ